MGGECCCQAVLCGSLREGSPGFRSVTERFPLVVFDVTLCRAVMTTTTKKGLKNFNHVGVPERIGRRQRRRQQQHYTAAALVRVDSELCGL